MIDERRVEQIAAWLAVFLRPGQWSELKGLQVGNRRAVNAFFQHTGLPALADMARQALRWEAEGATSVRFSMHPLRPDVAESRRFARSEDFIGYAWLFVDCEALANHSDSPASEEERAAAWQVLLRARGALEAFGMTRAIVGDSGNGWHLLYPLDLPAGDGSKQYLKGLLKNLSERCSDQQARVDPATYNLTDCLKVYGTLSRKGIATPGRPHRYSRLIEWGQS